MSAAHRFMNLDSNEVGYFITQVGMAAVSFGVSTEDATAVGTLLGKMFNVRCAPAVVFPPPPKGEKGKAASQSICLASSCPLADKSDCKVDAATKSYPNGTNGVAPQMVMGGTTNGTEGGDSGADSGSGSGSPASGATPAAWTGSLATFAALGLGAFGVATLL